jgi:3-oxoacyl-[acyl-carrier-protein] synthase II
LNLTEQTRARQRVWVTAVGCLSALGRGIEETKACLLKGEDPSRSPTLFSVEGCQGQRAAELADPEVSEVLTSKPESARWHRVTRMLWSALKEAALGAQDFRPEAAIFGTTSGGMSYGEAFYRALQGGESSRKYRRMVREYPPQQAAQTVLLEKGWPLPVRIISNACASGTNAVGVAWQMVALGRCQRVVCGGYDALSQLVFCGFDALKALSPDRCRPFDAERSGLILGEGAAVLFLESEAALAESGREPLAEMCGYGSLTDNHHLTQPEPGGSGPRAAMRAALASAGLVAEEVDYVNAHGTATALNDASEGRALAEVVSGAWISSTKGLSGHTLGAAGALEAVFSVLALQEGFYPRNVNLRVPDAAWPLRLVPEEGLPSSTAPPRVVVSNSFGFGGSNASLVLRRV